jgi:hypothetical protein
MTKIHRCYRLSNSLSGCCVRSLLIKIPCYGVPHGIYHALGGIAVHLGELMKPKFFKKSDVGSVREFTPEKCLYQGIPGYLFP